jgi:OmcA/MtrC family decaheme c-type cytochrome
MTTKSKNRISLAQRFLLAGLGTIALGLAGCSGSSDSSDATTPPEPTYPPGPGSGAPIPITSAKTIVASITRVSVPDDGRPVVELFLRDENYYSLTGLPAGNIYFVLARLEPAVNGASSTWHAITRRTEPFPGTPAPAPADPDHLTGTGPTNQATIEAATAGAWVDQGKGVYTYKFAKSLQGDAGIPYDGSLPHRVGLEIRLTPAIPANNAVYTFTPATNAPVNESGREIVDTATCNTCHEKLVVHGGARFDLQYCVMCHESYSYDAQSGNSIDMKVMIHKIHAGESLPSVSAGRPYGIFGYGNTFNDFGDVAYPQDLRYCETCHRESDTNTPQAGSWRQTVNAATCTSCHDTINFETGANHGGVAATEDTCNACHGPNSSTSRTPRQGRSRP